MAYRMYLLLPFCLFLLSIEAGGQTIPVWEDHPHAIELTAGYPFTLENLSWPDSKEDYDNGIVRETSYSPVFLLGYSYRMAKRWELSA